MDDFIIKKNILLLCLAVCVCACVAVCVLFVSWWGPVEISKTVPQVCVETASLTQHTLVCC